MSFEDHIRKNKEHFTVKKVSPELWDKVNENLILKPNNKSKSITLKIALMSSAACLLLFFVWQNYTQNQRLSSTQQQLVAMKTTINELLLDQSSFRRIKAVNMSNEIEGVDQEIVAALIKIMSFDKNKNVQLAAVNALENYASEETVKLALINALSSSEEDFFKIKLINILSNINEERVLPLLNQIIDDNSSHGYLKEEAISARKSIKSL